MTTIQRNGTHLLLAALASSALATGSMAASHREAPLIAKDPNADNTDTYAFISYDETNLRRPPEQRRVTFILNVLPGQDPADGPNYFEFDSRVLYRIHIDSNQDGRGGDVVYEFRFQTQTRPVGGALNFPLPYVGNPDIPASVPLRGITALNGPGSEGLTRRQTFTVTEVRSNGQRRQLFQGQTLYAVPSNVGPATMPSYENLASQGVYEDTANNMRVFAGQRAETFYIDLGAVFDTVNLRRSPPVLTQQEDAARTQNVFGVNRFSGTNVHSIAIEVPVTSVTFDGRPPSQTTFPRIGMFASTSRQSNPAVADSPFVQVSRLANPLINELIIDTPAKDGWNATPPQSEAAFLRFYQNPSLAQALQLIFGLPVPATPRNDLAALFLKYPGQPLNQQTCGFPCSELLRLDLRTAPVAAEQQNRLGGIARPTPDAAGFPNGRRPYDDVTDIAIRVVGGPAYNTNRVGDGVNFANGVPGAGTGDGVGYGEVRGNRLDVTFSGIAKEFPFQPTPFDGRNRRHVDCGEAGAAPCN